MGEKEENLEKVAEVIERHGLGIISFIALMVFLANQIYTSQKFTEELFKLEKIKIEQTTINNQRLTTIEKILEKMLEDRGK